MGQVTLLLLLAIASSSQAWVKENDVAEHITLLAEQIPIERFQNDISVSQQVDTVNTVSKYILLNDDKFIFERETNDKRKKVVVLAAIEDRIPYQVSKRVYVVMRQNEKNPKSYWINVAYLRPSTSADPEDYVFQVNGSANAIEWDRFDEHFVPGRSTITFYSLQCASAFIVPCTFEPKALTPAEIAAKSPRYMNKAAQGSFGDLLKITKTRPIVEGKYYDPLSYGDLFLDLAPRRGESAGAGKELEQTQPKPLYADVMTFSPGQDAAHSGVGILGAILTGVGGIACGIASILASCADERMYKNMMPIGMAATEGFRKNTWQLSHIGRRRKRQLGLDLEAGLDYPGWKTQYKKPIPGVVTGEVGFFYGLGNCPERVGGETSADEESILAIAHLHLKAIRAHCIPWMREFMQQLVIEGFLKLDNKTFILNPKTSAYHAAKLTLRESIQTAAAAEIDAISYTFRELLEENSQPASPPRAPDNRIISKSTHVLLHMGFNALERIDKYIPRHTIALRRHFYQTFQQIFSKLRQDGQSLGRCKGDCTADKEMTRNDRLVVMGMMRFIQHGSNALGSGQRAQTLYEHFYRKNFKLIEQMVNLFP